MKHSISITSLLFVLTIFLNACNEDSSSVEQVDIDPAKEQEALVARGEYLVNSIGCDHCHTPKKITPQGPVPDPERRLMGYTNGRELLDFDKNDIEPGKWVLFNDNVTAGVGPWGISFSANLTPHETGIGTWTLENFKRSIKEGKHKGLENGRPVMPPMPWEYYRNMSDEDVEAIFAFLHTIKPIENVVPAFIPFDEIE